MKLMSIIRKQMTNILKSGEENRANIGEVIIQKQVDKPSHLSEKRRFINNYNKINEMKKRKKSHSKNMSFSQKIFSIKHKLIPSLFDK